MADVSTIMRQRQLDVRSVVDARGFHWKAIASKAGLSYSTLLSYFPADKNAQPAQIPTGVVYALAESEALPLDVLSMLMPVGIAMLRIPEGIDHDEACAAMQDYLATKAAFHREDSECGPAIGPNEDATLRAKFAIVRAAA